MPPFKSTGLLIVVAAAIISCADQPGDIDPSVDAVVAGGTAKGAIPAGLPARELVGLFEDTGATWMKTSGAPWDVRYRYFTKGWVNNWGFGAYDGSWGLGYMRECDGQRFIPAVQYYQMNGEPGGSESAFLSKVQNATTMKSYFGDFKILMQRAKDFGKPVIILLEADGFGFLEQQTAGNSAAYAAVKDSGVAELAGLPNTVAGWGLAFLQLRKSVGANNAVLGIHISGWASGKDIAYGSVTDSLSPEVDKVYNFLAPFGLAANVTGATWDVLVGDPLDRDSDYYVLVQGQNRWWDASDSASINSKSFNRYAEWVRLWNVKATKRWILWQIPLGNSNHRNVANDGTARAGYKDNRPEYFFGNGTAHMAKFADAGVIGLLFGAGAGGQSSYQNDNYTDGQLFMKSRAGAILSAGGVTLATGGGTGAGGATGGGGATGSGGTTGTAGRGGTTGTAGTTGTGGTSADSAQYNFESGAQGWAVSGAPLTAAASSTTRAFAGTHALAVSAGGSGTATVTVSSPAAGPGKVVTFHFWVPSGSGISSLQPFVLQGASGNWTWTGNWRAISSLTTNAWNTVQLTVPTNAAPLAQLGVEVASGTSWTGTLYVDAVGW
jgi:hypothetical protein